MENKAYNEYIAQLDKVFEMINSTTKISNNSKSAESYIGSRNLKGQPHGQGTLTNYEGIRFTGNWVNGVLSGNGAIEYLDGKYEGFIKDFKQNGKGKKFNSDGRLLYEGEFDNGKWNGIGKEFHLKGEIEYEGEFKDGKWNGNGKEFNSDGRLIYEGEFKNKKKHGKGKEVLSNGEVYVGEWREGNYVVSDIDDNIYHSVTIGTQVWLVENLKTTRYRNGDPIPNISEYEKWSNLRSGACCNYENDSKNEKMYGKLYNWYSVDDNRNIAPAGWHVPTDKEWDTLINYLGGDKVAGDKLKPLGTTHWKYPNEGATNKSGFSALPGGLLCSALGGRFEGLGCSGSWWSSNEVSATEVCVRSMNNVNSKVHRIGFSKTDGCSVRCLRDFD